MSEFHLTQYGIGFGKAEIIRACSDENYGTFIIRTPKADYDIQITVSKSGCVFIYDRGECLLSIKKKRKKQYVEKQHVETLA